MNKYLTFKDHENGMRVARMLLEEDYVVMLSYEEDLLVVNYEFAPCSDRSFVTFISNDERDEELDKIIEDVRVDIVRDIKNGFIKID